MISESARQASQPLFSPYITLKNTNANSLKVIYITLKI